MKKILFNSMFILIALVVVSCNNKRKPNYVYMPNMYESVGYEAYQEGEIFDGNVEAQVPVEGTVSRGWKPYAYPNTNEGKASAKANLKNELPRTEENVLKGKELYNIYCGVCHGDKGDGQGILAKREKIMGIPPYNDAGRAITEGSIYHVMYWGINTMGSYASQTSEEERWAIIHYVNELKDKLDGKEVLPYEVEGVTTEEELNTSEEHADASHAEGSDHESQGHE